MTQHDVKPPGPGRGVILGEPVTPSSQFVVEYEDERYVFESGSWGRFGRDDDVCEIPVWEELNSDMLSRVAGELWVMDGQLWARNLSQAHELGVFGNTGPPVWLPARAPGERGRACSVPAPDAWLRTPTTGDWVITAHQISTQDLSASMATRGSTVRLDPVPPAFVPLAVALCEPLLADAGAPATYDEVAHRLGITKRQARRAVERLCTHYVGCLSRQRPQHDATTPTYAYLARLLVNRGLIGHDQVRDSYDVHD